MQNSILLNHYKWYLEHLDKKELKHYTGSAKRLVSKLESMSMPLAKLTKTFIEKHFSAKAVRYRMYSFLAYLEKQNVITSEKAYELNNSVKDDFNALFSHFEEHLLKRRVSKKSLAKYKNSLKHFESYLKSAGILSFSEIKRKTVEMYKQYLHTYRNSVTGKPLAHSNKTACFNILCYFFRTLKRLKRIEYDITAGVKSIKRPKLLTQNFFTQKEIKELFRGLPKKSLLEKRDFVMYYSAYFLGLRISEVSKLKISDIDFTNSLVYIRDTKRNGSRVIPMLKPIFKMLEIYIRRIRSRLVNNSSDELFLTQYKTAFKGDNIKKCFSRTREKLKIKKPVSFHAFRNSIATHLLKNGMDLRIIQKFLGHKRISSTTQYIKIVPDDLKKAVRKYHPSDRKNNQDDRGEKSDGKNRSKNSR